jgi:DDHD domain
MMPYVVGDAGVGAPLVKYPQLSFRPANFFALGSPVAMFLAVRGISSLGEDFHLPTCPGFFNIFHPASVHVFGIDFCVFFA